jgi:hypothetical protein
MAGISDVQTVTADDPAAAVNLGALPGAAVELSITVSNTASVPVFITSAGAIAASGYPVSPGSVVRVTDKFGSADTIGLFSSVASVCQVHVDRGGTTEVSVLKDPTA